MRDSGVSVELPHLYDLRQPVYQHTWIRSPLASGDRCPLVSAGVVVAVDDEDDDDRLDERCRRFRFLDDDDASKSRSDHASGDDGGTIPAPNDAGASLASTAGRVVILCATEIRFSARLVGPASPRIIGDCDDVVPRASLMKTFVWNTSSRLPFSHERAGTASLSGRR